jgi:hypothetical protein
VNTTPHPRGQEPAFARTGFVPSQGANHVWGLPRTEATITTPATGLSIREHFVVTLLAALLHADQDVATLVILDGGPTSSARAITDRAVRAAVTLADSLLSTLCTTDHPTSQYAKAVRPESAETGGVL